MGSKDPCTKVLTSSIDIKYQLRLRRIVRSDCSLLQLYSWRSHPRLGTAHRAHLQCCCQAIGGDEQTLVTLKAREECPPGLAGEALLLWVTTVVSSMVLTAPAARAVLGLPAAPTWEQVFEAKCNFLTRAHRCRCKHARSQDKVSKRNQLEANTCERATSVNTKPTHVVVKKSI
eukprot:4879087-Amphidinium_carterae.1